MKVKIFCEKCSKYDVLDLEIEKKEEPKKSTLPFALPVPTSGGDSGLETLSIVHSDHILVADVDKNGDVRKFKILDRVGNNLEKDVAKIANTVINHVLSTSIQPATFIFLTTSRNIEKVLLGIFQQILFNLPKNNEVLSTLSVSNHMAIFELDNLTVYVGQWKEKIVNIAGSNSVIVHHITQDNSPTVMANIERIKEMKSQAETILIFDDKLIKEPNGKKLIGEIMLTCSPKAILDVSNTNNIAKNIERIVDMYLPNMSELSQFI
ncbi:MAG: hypothetical protein INQ03_03300 [Candidatus Heimdallarchaeota archaeon]|nr:hypothetical protein [Candidatus Heimdallarchaeota archaeon]